MGDPPYARKSLGQHWLHDPAALEAIVQAAEVQASDTVLEIGPGTGTLTEFLVHSAKQVVAVELDAALANELPRRLPESNLWVIQQDILRFDFSQLPAGFKAVANIPYYLTNNLLRILCEQTNFSRAALLVQKEVAERVVAEPGRMSVLSVSVQFYCQANAGQVVPAELFTPPPKVDSQILILERRREPLFPDVNAKQFFRFVRAGFSQRRKTLENALSGGLNQDKTQVAGRLQLAHIDPRLRAQNLSLQQWYSLYQVMADT